MAKKRKKAKRLQPLKVGDPAFQKACAILDAGMHALNADWAQPAGDGRLYRIPVGCRRGNHAANRARPRRALALAEALDGLIPKSLEFLTQWTGLARIPTSESPTTLDIAEFRERLMRRAEHWKSQAFAAVAEQAEETSEQRGLRRQRILDPLLEKAGFTSDDAWAERAGDATDRNTPRDYRSGKTAERP